MNVVQSAFYELLNRIRKSLRSLELNPEQLAKQVLSLGTHASGNVQRPICEQHKRKLTASTSTDESFKILGDYLSFFNFELLAWIINSEKLCTDEDRQQLLLYRERFKEFSKRKVTEIPFKALRLNTRDDSNWYWTRFATLLTADRYNLTLLEADDVRHKLATLLGLHARTLHLEWIDKGGLILVFSVPNFVAERLFPLDEHQAQCLKSKGFTIFVSSAVGTGKIILLCSAVW